MSIFVNTRHKSVNIATFLERAVTIRLSESSITKPTYPSIFPESFAKINQSTLVETWGNVCILAMCAPTHTHANEQHDLRGYRTKVQEMFSRRRDIIANFNAIIGVVIIQSVVKCQHEQ